MTNQTHFHFKLLVWMSNKRLGNPHSFPFILKLGTPNYFFFLVKLLRFRVVLSPANSHYHFTDSRKVPASQALFNESGQKPVMIPKPKLWAFFGVESLTKPTFGLTSAEFLVPHRIHGTGIFTLKKKQMPLE